MKPMNKTRWGSLAVAGLLLLSACGAEPEGQTPDDRPKPVSPAPECADGEPLAHEFESGARWSLCWSVEPDHGMVLSDIYFEAPEGRSQRVIDTIAIAQLEVPYDSGERLTSDITDAGFGGTWMKTLTEQECTGDLHSTEIPNIGDGTHGLTPDREVLCSTTVDAGLGYRSQENGTLTTTQASEWNVYTVSKVGWYEYISQYVFTADGTIRPQLGATGDLSPVDFADEDHGWPIGEGEADYAASHSHNAIWRVDWGLGDGQAQAVEQYDAVETGDEGRKSRIVEGSLSRIESPAVAHKADRRWWRVLAPETLNADGHPVSYEIGLEKTDSFTTLRDEHHHGDDAGYDVAFTNADDCQRFATYNPTSDGCGRGVLDFVEDGEDEELHDVVSWVAVGFHHVPRDEDQSPMEMHWQGFTLQPRDLNAQRPGLPEGREHLNGQPDEWQGEDVDDLTERDSGGLIE
ncbi:copper amine oxidase [Zhihengliuella halotolerans]|uniref:copper amine oxidase n=1 Tax=Zhihengliuella halotolerans TaxID=370736 RepID=UPI0030FEFFD6